MTSLSRHVTGGIKATSRGFSGSRSRDRRKLIIFHLKDDDGKLWVEMIIVRDWSKSIGGVGGPEQREGGS